MMCIKRSTDIYTINIYDNNICETLVIKKKSLTKNFRKIFLNLIQEVVFK